MDTSLQNEDVSGVRHQYMWLHFRLKMYLCASVVSVSCKFVLFCVRIMIVIKPLGRATVRVDRRESSNQLQPLRRLLRRMPNKGLKLLSRLTKDTYMLGLAVVKQQIVIALQRE